VILCVVDIIEYEALLHLGEESSDVSIGFIVLSLDIVTEVAPSSPLK
jgi:hypothetical protein